MAASTSSTLNEGKSCDIELGFVECSTDIWKLKSKFFPSKIGGKPSWLDLKYLPSPDELQCTICGDPCVFLLQIYAPLENLEYTFHRTLFLFVCKNPDCLHKSNCDGLLVFRCQLPRKNEFYNFEPPVENPLDAESPSAGDYCKLCVVCGCLGNKSCAKCHQRHYCCKAHQGIDWKSGHKWECSEMASSHKVSRHSFLLKEYEVIRDAEMYQDNEEKSEEAKMEEYQRFVDSQKACSLSEPGSEGVSRDLEAMAAKSDKIFNKFRKRIEHEPNQVLRYERGGEPLWVSSTNLPEAVPPCFCGAKRIYEFQVMPQLLNYLQLDTLEDSIDWGTIVIYTCSRSCNDGPSYHREFVWKQDFDADKK